MTDEAKPKRQYGQREREAAYRAGFLDGLQHAHNEIREQRALEDKRTVAMDEGMQRLKAEPVVKRTRRRTGQAGQPAVTEPS